MKFSPIFLIIPLVLCGFGSCSSPLTHVCQTRLPEYERAFDEAELRLKDQLASRAIASDSPKNETAQAWMKWAVENLKETQHWQDAVESSAASSARTKALKSELSAMANDWVAFHGFTQLGKTRQMSFSLVRIREHTRAARALACAPSPADQE